MDALSSRQVVFRIAAIIFVAEFFIMLALARFGPADPVAVAYIDVALLSLVTTPAIYFWVIRSFVNARDEALAEVRALALTDPLTQLANRRLLATHLRRILSGSASHRVRGALLLIDLDGFKAINDRHGHDAGDALLVAVARRLETVIRGEDMAARLGGDEFVVLIDRLDRDSVPSREHAVEVARRVIELVSMPVEYEGATLRVGASVGVRIIGDEQSAGPESSQDPISRVISEADSAMYAAKRAGRGRVSVYGDRIASPDR